MQTSLATLYRDKHQFVLAQFQASSLTYREIARRTGISHRTVEKIAREEIAEPSVDAVETLAEFFRKQA